MVKYSDRVCLLFKSSVCFDISVGSGLIACISHFNTHAHSLTLLRGLNISDWKQNPKLSKPRQLTARPKQTNPVESWFSSPPPSQSRIRFRIRFLTWSSPCSWRTAPRACPWCPRPLLSPGPLRCRSPPSGPYWGTRRSPGDDTCQSNSRGGDSEKDSRSTSRKSLKSQKEGGQKKRKK